MAKDKLYFEKDAIIACTEYTAKYFGVTAQTLANWDKDNCPKHSYGYWNIKDVSDYLQNKQGLKMAEEAEKDPEKMGISAQKMYFESQLKEAQLENMNFKNAVNKGEYLERKFVVDSLKSFMVILKRSLKGLGNKLAKEVAPYIGQDEARQVNQLITDTINDALEQMSVEGVYNAKTE